MTERVNPERDELLDDVEGHRRVMATDEEDVEGHARMRMVTADEDDDVEGHVQPPRDLDIDR